MEKQLEILRALEINLELFYTISFRQDEIRLQGTLTYEAIKEAEKFVTLEEDGIDWLRGNKNGIYITLCK